MNLEAVVTEQNGQVIGTYRPGHFNGDTKNIQRGSFTLQSTIELPHFTRGDFIFTLYLTNPCVEGLWDLPNCLLLHSDGHPMVVTGLVLENRLGAGSLVFGGATVLKQ